MANLTSVKIFPCIGIARLGNSSEWFMGPELPFPAPPPVPADGHYKDPQCRIRRQAQRFRLWGMFDDGSNRELTAADGTIQWTVHLANAKAVFQGEAGGLIDPGARTLNGPNDSATFANGTYAVSGVDVEVPLGEALTDQDGRLIVAGGFGFSNSPVGNAIGSFWSNPGWHDDVSDGPVNATITVGGHVFQAAGAWVICPPPRYAPGTYSPISLYDTIRQVAINQNMLPHPGQPSFVKDIWPILTRAEGMLRVAAAAFGAGDHGSMASVIPPGPGQDVARQAILGKLAPPPGPGNVGIPNQPANMPLLNSGGALGADPADILPTLRQFQYDQMSGWSQNNFINDWPPVAPTAITPDGLTQAALENCVGAPFFPGIEATVSVNDGTLKYTEPFRFDQTNMRPGDATKGMARPWQADFNACTSSDSPDSKAWWPAARPYSIYTPGSNAPVDWTRGIITSAQDMVDNWSRLGFIVDPGNGQPVETERTVVCKDCIVVTERNEIGKEEAFALAQSGQPIMDGFFVIIEGFAPNFIGITSANLSATQLQALFPTLVTLSPNPVQMHAVINDMLLEDNNALGNAQRITLGYNITFSGVNDFTNAVVPIQVIAAIQGVSSSAVIDLTPIDSPYMDHGPVSWLSNDTRVFKLQPNGSVGGVTLGNDPIAFIQALLAKLRTQNTAAEIQQNYQIYENLPATEAGAELEWLPTLNNQPVWNFALGRVRYRATTTPANDVRVFFRLFQTAATGTEYNPATTYRVGGQPGVKIPLLGIQGGELVTIPFFAEARNSASVNLNQQKDDTNKQTINPGVNGAEAYMYFGCWLDINQPNDLRFPIQPSPNDGGPFTGPLQSIANLIRGTHQCMVTEINFDPDPILPVGVSTAATQKLSQRNLAIDHSDNPGAADAHRVQHTFAIHPTTSTPAAGQGPDELMIAWGGVPNGTPASIYLPGVRAAEVLDLANRRFDLQTLSRIDDHTLGCKAAGVTYLPIPAGGPLDLAGLITLDLPQTVRTGELFRIVLRQIVDGPAPAARTGPTVDRGRSRARAARAVNAAVAVPPVRHRPRHILGAFQLSILVRTAREILPGDERTLVALRRVLATVPVENRWYPVLQRYTAQLCTRIGALGGTVGGQHPPPHPHPHPEGGGPEGREHRTEYEGKIAGLCFDRFGDFDGFLLDTEDGKRQFRSREANVERLAHEAWEERIAVLVVTEREGQSDREEFRAMVLLRTAVGPSRGGA